MAEMAAAASQTMVSEPYPPEPLERTAGLGLSSLVLAIEDKDVTVMDVDKIDGRQIEKATCFLTTLIFDLPRAADEFENGLKIQKPWPHVSWVGPFPHRQLLSNSEPFF
jgi:hypothetical protein